MAVGPVGATRPGALTLPDPLAEAVERRGGVPWAVVSGGAVPWT
ncbi:hypothetical protein [Planotetraspora kaengkrachanensis]|nr:hypothetical protein [Planotetraspora kaengkrachanensis]